MPSKAELTERARMEMGLDEDLNEITAKDKYNDLRNVVINNFDSRVWFLLDACLSVIATLMLEDLPNPVGLNLVDGPSSEKTTVLSMLYGLDMVYRSDSFTPASFVSHAANRTEKQLEKADLLPKIKDKCLIVPELAPIFGARQEDLLKNFSILTRVFDGEGLMTDSGSHGHRGYEGDYHFAWLGATTPISQNVWNVMGQLGSRLLFLTADNRLTQKERITRTINDLRSSTPYTKRVKKCREAIKQYIQFLIINRIGGKYHRSVEWDIGNDNSDIIDKIGCLAELTARARSKVAWWPTENRYNDDDEGYTQPIIEGPARIMSVLYGLARGHAILEGRSRLTDCDLPLIVAISLSSMPDDRRQVIDLMVDRDHPKKSSDCGEVTSTEIDEILGYSRPTAIKTMKKLSILKVGKYSEIGGSAASRLRLSETYDWLLTEEFANLRRVWENGNGYNDQTDIPF
jgi:hypothetical protein